MTHEADSTRARRGSYYPYSFVKKQYVNVSLPNNVTTHPLQDSLGYSFSRFVRDTGIRNAKTFDRIVQIDISKLIEGMVSKDWHKFELASDAMKRTMVRVFESITNTYMEARPNVRATEEDIYIVVKDIYSAFEGSPLFSLTAERYGNESWLRQLITGKFGARDTYNMPPSVWYDRYEQLMQNERNGISNGPQETDRVLRNHVQYTMFPDIWTNLPLHYIGIPIVSNEFLDYALDGGSYSSLSKDVLYYRSKTAKNWFTAKKSYWYSVGQNGQFFDNATGSWLSTTVQQNKRKYVNCQVCYQKHDVQFMDWFRTRGWDTSRKRICFNCIAISAFSYNPWQQCWIIAHNSNTEDIVSARFDRPVKYVHVDDTDKKPVGRRDYDWRVDVYYLQNANSFADVPNFYPEQISLPIETRRYLTWLRKLKTATRMNVGFSLDRVRRSHIHNEYRSQLTLDEFVYEHENVVTNFPAQVKQTEDSMYVTMWIDNKMESRDFTRQYANPRTNTRVTDDGWLEPDHGVRNMNKALNNYSYKPDFYYVDYFDNKWFSTFTESPTVDAMECPEHEGKMAHVNCPSWHRKYGLFMGLELELIARDTRMLDNIEPSQLFERTIETFHANKYRGTCYDLVPQLLYAKRDGSLPSYTGVEFISQPMSMRAWQQVPKTFWYMTENNYKAHSVGGVGIHIHIPWAAFTEIHAFTFLSALQALQINRHGFLRNVAQRPSNDWTAWDELEYSNVPNTIAAVVQSRRAQNSSKYQGINLLHTSTIELRYFNSNAKGGRVLKNLQFVQAIYDYAGYLADQGEWEGELGPNQDLLDHTQSWRHWDATATVSIKNAMLENPKEDNPLLNIETELFTWIQEHRSNYPNLWAFMMRDEDDLVISESEIKSLWEQPEEVELVESTQKVHKTVNTRSGDIEIEIQ